MFNLNVIAGYRKMLELTQEDMGILLGIAEGTYRNKENGRAKFNSDELSNLYNFFSDRLPFDIDASYFFTNVPTHSDE